MVNNNIVYQQNFFKNFILKQTEKLKNMYHWNLCRQYKAHDLK